MSVPVTILQGEFGRVGLMSMDSPLAMHVHHHCHFIFKAGGEDTLFEVCGTKHALNGETAVLVNAWEPHQWAPQNGARETLFLTFYIEPDWLAKVLGSSSLHTLHPHTQDTCVRLGHLSQSLIQSLVNLMQNMSSNSENCAIELVDKIAIHIIEQHWNSPGRVARNNIVFDHRIRSAIRHMNTIDSGPHPLNQLARRVGLSRSHFFKLFHQQTGFSPLMFVNAHRMETAIAGITQRDISLINLAFDLGFSTHGNFTRFFRQQVGVTPSKFQRATVEV